MAVLPREINSILVQTLEAQPLISALDFTEVVISDHKAKYGCGFIEDAAIDALQRSAIQPLSLASDIPPPALIDLAYALDSLEVNCPEHL